MVTGLSSGPIGTARVYNAANNKCMVKLEGHEGEISKVSTVSSPKVIHIYIQYGVFLYLLISFIIFFFLRSILHLSNHSVFFIL